MEARQAGLNNEEGGANEDTHEDKEKALFPEQVVDGSGEGSGMF